jgi:hypothetical protein
MLASSPMVTSPTTNAGSDDTEGANCGCGLERRNLFVEGHRAYISGSTSACNLRCSQLRQVMKPAISSS